MEVALKGMGVSPGIAIGPAVTFQVQNLEIQRYAITDPGAELARYDDAVGRARVTLDGLRSQLEDDLGSQHAAIFTTHIELLEDVTLRPEVERRLGEEKVNAEFIVNDIIENYRKILEQVDDPLFRERSSDLVDVGRRILGNLMQRELESLEQLERPCIVVSHDLSPSDTVNMDMTNTLAIATDEGGPTSHMAILARAFEIPCVVALKYLGTQVLPNDKIIVDGSTGAVVVRPSEETLERYRSEKARQEAERAELLSAEKPGPVSTLDGHEIPTLANIELLAETEHSLNAHCQGIGLYRTEYLFMNRVALPDEDEQYAVYSQIMEKMAPLPVTIRTLDLGGDKVIPQLYTEPELNPQLGWRSIRMCLDRPDIFKAQLAALYRASVHGKMRIMFPMISGLDQLMEAKQVVREVCEDLDKRGIEYDPDVEIGSMIEVPAAVALAHVLVRECDFLSIGSNDLIQYCLAVDRVNHRTAHLYEPTHPGVLAMLKQTLDAAKKADVPCSICGEMAGDPMLTELLLGIGFESLSMSAASLPRVRATIAQTRISKARRLARKVLAMGSSSEIRELLTQRFQDASAVTPADQRKTG